MIDPHLLKDVWENCVLAFVMWRANEQLILEDDGMTSFGNHSAITEKWYLITAFMEI